MDADNSLNEDQINGNDDSRREGEAESKSFCLLNAKSDLLMLPKDMLVDRSIRKEVCPTLGLSIIMRILWNFTPDEFGPDPVPGTVLEALSYEVVNLKEARDFSNNKKCIYVFKVMGLVDIFRDKVIDISVHSLTIEMSNVNPSSFQQMWTSNLSWLPPRRTDYFLPLIFLRLSLC